MIRGIYYVGGDFTEGKVSNSAAETEVLDFDIPAGTVTNGIIVIANTNTIMDGGAVRETAFRIKVGTNGAEVERAKVITDTYTYDVNWQNYNGHIIAVVDDEDWNAAQTVSVTVDMDFANASDSAAGEYVVILGY